MLVETFGFVKVLLTELIFWCVSCERGEGGGADTVPMTNALSDRLSRPPECLSGTGSPSALRVSLLGSSVSEQTAGQVRVAGAAGAEEEPKIEVDDSAPS